MKNFSLLGVKLSLLQEAQILADLETFLKNSKLNHVATVNPEFLVEAHTNSDFKKLLNHTALNVCDGFGIKLWTKILYKTNITRLTGVALAEKICEIATAKQKSVYFLGGFGVAKPAAEHMKTQYPSLMIAGAEDGSPEKLSTKIIQAKPAIILVAFGAPTQEFWIDKFKADLKHTKIAVGVGGTFDFWAGKAWRAPKLVQRLGLEWLWRLISQPKRAKRIYKAVLVFSWLVLKEKFQGRP